MRLNVTLWLTICFFLAGSLLMNFDKKEAIGAKLTGQKLTLLSFGPREVKAGQDFNVQLKGGSALWAQGDGITPTTIVVINNVKLHGFRLPGKEKVITTPVPKELYAIPGNYPIYLLDTKTNVKSNELKFTIK
jgi:hypothetical protein